MPQEQPLISVIVPVYKVEAYLDQCVESIVNQTYRNLEIILVDDGSPDRCPEMCDAWAKKDSRIKVVHKENGGLGDARNAGIAVASGDYFGFIDSDDWCEPDMFRDLIESCLLYNSPIAVCDAFIEWECGWPTEYEKFAEERSCLGKQETLRDFFSGKLTAWACNKLYRKDLCPYLKYSSQAYEDIPVAREIFSHVEKVAFTGKCAYHYRQRQGSIVNASVNPSQLMLIEELRLNRDVARTFAQEGPATARLVQSCFNFLEKVYSSKSHAVDDSVSKLLQEIRAGKTYIKDVKGGHCVDRFFMILVAARVPYKLVFGIRRLLQWAYWKLNLNGKAGR